MDDDANDVVSTSLDLDGSSQPHILVTREAVQLMLTHAKAGFPLEIGGHLLGRKLVDERTGTPLTYIDRAMKADADSTRTHVSFRTTHAVLVHETCERLNMQVVGYYHSHPGLGVFQSGEDVHNFSVYYPYRHQVAVVIDPTRARRALTIAPDWLGFFAWDEQMRPVLLPASAISLLVDPIAFDDGAGVTGEPAGERVSAAPDGPSNAAAEEPAADAGVAAPAEASGTDAGSGALGDLRAAVMQHLPDAIQRRVRKQ